MARAERCEVYAHRGASGYAPENTLEAFALAVSQGADGIELDVQLSKDGELVVIHDEVLDRTTSGKGFVKDYTLAELKSFQANRTFPEYEQAVIPTLREVFELIRPSDLKINVELKTGIFWYPQIEEKCLALAKEMGMEERVIYSSFNHYSIQKLLALKPDAQTGILYGDVMLDVVDYAGKLGTAALHPALYHTWMADFLDQYVESDLAVRVWTINEEPDMKKLMEAGVDAVITNYPDRAIRVRESLCQEDGI